MKRAVFAALFLTAVRLYANCRSATPPSQYSVQFQAPECNSSAPCVQGASIHFSIEPATGCYIPFYPYPCPAPYVIDECDSLTWDFSDGTAPTVVAGSGKVDHVFPKSGNFPIHVTITNGGGSTTIHGSAYVNAGPTTIVHFAQSRYDVSESAGTLTVTLERSGDTARPFTLNYITSSWLANGDYDRNLEVINGPVSFAAGETTKQVVHHIKNDAVFTGDREPSVGVTSDGDVVMSGGPVEAVIVHITDDEPGPQFTIDDISVAEGNGEHTVDIPLRLSSPAGDYVYAWCLPHDGTARANVDFRPYGSTAVFEPGQTTATCQIKIIGNVIPENDKTLTISTNPVTGPVKVVRGDAVLTLTNDDVVAGPPSPPPPLPVPPPPPTLAFDGTSLRMSSGTNVSLQLDSNQHLTATLSSSDPKIVDVADTASVPGPVKLYALKPGTATIFATATVAGGGTIIATLDVEVTPPPRRRATH